MVQLNAATYKSLTGPGAENDANVKHKNSSIVQSECKHTVCDLGLRFGGVRRQRSMRACAKGRLLLITDQIVNRNSGGHEKK